MAASTSAYKDREFIAVIGDEVRLPVIPPPPGHTYSSTQESITGLLLAGIGHVTGPPAPSKTFFPVKAETETLAIEEAFDNFVRHRKDIAIVLINQHIADRIRHRVDSHTEAFPALLEIPSKDHPYDPSKDSVLRRVRKIFGE
ncbi:MAG: H(+)-transporting V1 sector ATPase subunit F [Trizodia sp. TS-e1964]|nr:MAG: H(+)-transporting V1 sector ATPase subunit F [Trizodia sp. TS-e1964]